MKKNTLMYLALAAAGYWLWKKNEDKKKLLASAAANAQIDAALRAGN